MPVIEHAGFGCGRKAPTKAVLRFTRGRSTSKLVTIEPKGRSQICVSGGRGQLVLVDLQARGW